MIGSPFDKSTKTQRSPPIQKASRNTETPTETKQTGTETQKETTQQDSQIKRTRIQSISDKPTNLKVHTTTKQPTVPQPKIIKVEPIDTIEVTDTTPNNLTNKTKTTNTEVLAENQRPQQKPSTQVDKPNTVTTNNMANTRDIQQNIANSVPEFSGENQITRANELIRFTATADNIYQTLGSEEERKIFVRLIKLRLTGEAFTRISHRNIEDYPTLRELLNNMYSKTYSLEELERGYTNIQQSYGETIRNYGYRLLEALERYQAGYQTKYKLQRIDETYKKHMEANAVVIFKRGLNNIILKEKVATSTAKNIDEIVNETEIIEGMLTITTNTPTSHNLTQNPLPNFLISHPTTQHQNSQHRVICNYCQRPNHTWDICRIRMNQERIKRIATQRHQEQRYHSPGTYHNPAYPEVHNKQHYTPPQQNPNHYKPTQQPLHFNKINGRQPKYCSHCKTTTGHTFDECRSKFFTKNTYQPNTNNNTPTDTRELTDRFNNMRINMIYPQPGLNPVPPAQHTHPENSNGSNQL